MEPERINRTYVAQTPKGRVICEARQHPVNSYDKSGAEVYTSAPDFFISFSLQMLSWHMERGAFGAPLIIPYSSSSVTIRP